MTPEQHLILKEIEELLDDIGFLTDLSGEVLCVDNCAMILFETTGVLTISFHIDTKPDDAANIIKTITENEIDIEIFECYWFDENDDFCVESDNSLLKIKKERLN